MEGKIKIEWMCKTQFSLLLFSSAISGFFGLSRDDESRELETEKKSKEYEKTKKLNAERVNKNQTYSNG